MLTSENDRQLSSDPLTSENDKITKTKSDQNQDQKIMVEEDAYGQLLDFDQTDESPKVQQQ